MPKTKTKSTRDDFNRRLNKLDQRINRIEKELQVIKFNMATKESVEKVGEEMATKNDLGKITVFLDKILKNTEKLDQERILTFYRIEEIEKRLGKSEQEIKKLKLALAS